MQDKAKRFAISTIETFAVVFVLAALTTIEPAINSGLFPTKELLVSAAAAGAIAVSKAAVKALREYLSGAKAGEGSEKQ